jgi:hypothetical protein
VCSTDSECHGPTTCPVEQQEELTAAERCSGILVKLARAKDVPRCKAGRTGAQLAEAVEAGLQQLLEYLQKTSVPMKLAVAR